MKTIRDYINLIENLQREGMAEAAGPIVLVHKAYRENLAKAKEALERFHSPNGSKLEILPPSGKYGSDYYEFHLPANPHNSIEAVQSTLKGEGVKAEVVPGTQGVVEEQVEESSPDAIAKINELTRR